jgi:cell division septal protein FtsQ
MNKTYIFIVIIVIVVVGIWLWSRPPVSNAPVGNNAETSAVDTTASINQDLNNVNIETPDFEAIDTDLNSL